MNCDKCEHFNNSDGECSLDAHCAIELRDEALEEAAVACDEIRYVNNEPFKSAEYTSGFFAETLDGSFSELRERYCQPSKSTWLSRSVRHASSTAGLNVTTSTRFAPSFFAS